MAEVKKSKAVALKYDIDSNVAPVVIASGCGYEAERIIDVAERMGIPVYRDDSAASLMCMLQVGSSIPTELYQIVAGIYCEILAMSAELKSYEKKDNPAHQRLSALSEKFREQAREQPQEID